MQQAGVVRILDVLEHQLPVAANTLAHIPEHPQSAPVEDPVEVEQHGRAEVFCERGDPRIERSEDDPLALSHAQALERMLLQFEVLRHAALLLEAPPERDAA